MNYFELHLGDYAEATAHLSMLEDAAYMRLLRKYYATERPIPADIPAAQRLVAARSADERQAVEDVLREFFDLREDGWHNRRADEAIEKYREGDADREARRENEKERQRRTRDARRLMFDALRDRGVIPAWDTPMSELRSVHDKVMSQPVTRDITSTTDVRPAIATATQSPIPNNQEKAYAAEAPASAASKRGSRLPDDWQPQESELRWAVDACPGIDAKREAEKFRDYWRAKAGKDGVKLDWQATFRNWLRNAKPGGTMSQFRTHEPARQALRPLS